MIDGDTCLAEFERHRPLLFGIAYRMLGSVMEAEDAVQESFLRYSSARPEAVREPQAFLRTVVTRICLDQLKSARASRETYIGPWLPEPLVRAAGDAEGSPEDVAEQHESISMAFLVLLESLTPLERAVFLLREVFDYGYDEVARIVGRSEPACRQTFHRAKAHVVARRPRFEATREEQERLVHSFVEACTSGDLASLRSLLADDVTLWSDGGGKRTAALNPILGSDRVARFILGAIRLDGRLAEYRVAIVEINGRPGVLIAIDESAEVAIDIEIHAGHIQEIRAVVNPDKLARIAPL